MLGVPLALASQARAAADVARGADLAQLRRNALEAVNGSRSANGLSALELAPALNEAARVHAGDMLKRDYFAHESPEGNTVQDRYEKAGGSKWRLVAENIARYSNYRAPLTPATVESLQQGWMNSPPHRANILHKGLTQFGFGIAAGENGDVYAVQTFAGPGTPRGLEAGEQPAALTAEELSGRALRAVNKARRDAGAAPLEASAALREGAGTLLPDPGADTFNLTARGNLFDALPQAARAQWQAVSVVAGACGGCGKEPTAADVRSFTRDWLNNPQYRDTLLDPKFTDFGFALEADREGKKVALAIVGESR